MWLLFEHKAGLAGIIPAVVAIPFAIWRGRFVELRAGYVTFSEARRSWERRSLAGFLIGGLGPLPSPSVPSS